MRKALTALLAASVIALTVVYCQPATPAKAKNCKDVIFVFARGSGQNLDDSEYQAYRSAIKTAIKEKNLDINYGFYELGTATYNDARYPAVALNFMNTITTIISAGTAFDYGKSIKQGTSELTGYIQDITSSCKNTKFVLAGYSQGAQVVSESLSQINPKKILYAATFGDPKSYLPEGRGIDPPACHNKDLSPYRAYVPNCRTHKGSLGAKIPYQEVGWDQKIGLYCNDKDLICGAGLNLSTSGDKNLSFLERLRQNAMVAHTKYFSQEKLSLVSDNIIKRIATTKSSSTTQNSSHSSNQQNVQPGSTTDISNLQPWPTPSEKPIANAQNFEKVILLDYKLITNNTISYQKMHKFLFNQFVTSNIGHFTFYNIPAFDDDYKSNIFYPCTTNPTNNVLDVACANIAWNDIVGSMISSTDTLLSRLNHIIDYWSFTKNKQFIVAISNDSLLANPDLTTAIKKIQENSGVHITVLPEDQIRAINLATINPSSNQVFAKTQRQQSTPSDRILLAIENLLTPAKNLFLQKNASAVSKENSPPIALTAKSSLMSLDGQSSPTISNLSYNQSDKIGTVKFNYSGGAVAAFVTLNDAPLGLTEQNTIRITDIVSGSKLLLTPIDQNGNLGEQVELLLGESKSKNTSIHNQETAPRLNYAETYLENGSNASLRSIPLVPDCGTI